MYNSEMKVLPNQKKKKKRNFHLIKENLEAMKEGDKTNEEGNISEWLNLKKLNVKKWEKRVKIHRTKC